MTGAKMFRVTVVYGYVGKHVAAFASGDAGPESAAWWAGMLVAVIVLNLVEVFDTIEREATP